MSPSGITLMDKLVSARHDKFKAAITKQLKVKLCITIEIGDPLENYPKRPQLVFHMMQEFNLLGSTMCVPL